MLFLRQGLKSFLFPSCSSPVADETLPLCSRDQRAAWDRSGSAGGLLMLSGSAIKRERGAPKTKAHPREARRTGSRKEPRLLYFTVPKLNTFALLIVFNARRGKERAAKPSGDSSRISSVRRSQESWRTFKNFGSTAAGLCLERRP